jgi:hypothetical protein
MHLSNARSLLLAAAVAFLLTPLLQSPGADAQALPGGPHLLSGRVAADGSVLAGAGFTVSHFRTGGYLVTFTVPFAVPPVVVGSEETTAFNGQVVVESVSAGSVQLGTSNASGSGADSAFHFMVAGIP